MANGPYTDVVLRIRVSQPREAPSRKRTRHTHASPTGMGYQSLFATLPSTWARATSGALLTGDTQPLRQLHAHDVHMNDRTARCSNGTVWYNMHVPPPTGSFSTAAPIGAVLTHTLAPVQPLVPTQQCIFVFSVKEDTSRDLFGYKAVVQCACCLGEDLLIGCVEIDFPLNIMGWTFYELQGIEYCI